MACAEGQLELARLLLEASAAVNQADAHGTTPLSMACQMGHLETARLLCDADAAVGQASDDGVTPLLMACQEGHVETARLLSSRLARRSTKLTLKASRR